MVYRGGYLVLWRTERKECWRAFRRGRTTNLDRWSPAPRGLNRRSRHLFGRVLDASLRAVQGTSSDTLLAADMEEIVRRVEEAITNRMSMFQQPAPMGWDAQWHTQQSSFPGPAWGAPPADVRYGAQGYPPPSFGRGGQGSIYRIIKLSTNKWRQRFWTLRSLSTSKRKRIMAGREHPWRHYGVHDDVRVRVCGRSKWEGRRSL